ncbi:MAG: mechanosensitive ion channel [Candidatus Sericytochromatia bacterium]|nr:mechanosensitive ion channel [Candidatus Sericytochromatia bacterium]
METLWQKALELAMTHGPRILGSLVIVFIGLWLSRKLARIGQEALGKTSLDATFTNIAGHVIKILLYGVVLLAAANNIGVPMTSVLALLGTAGLAVALALKDSLNNVAAGISLLILRPFRAGDYVEAGGVGGTVFEINFFHTLLNTPDNRRIAIPNAKILAESIINFSANPTRRVDLVFGISYDADLKQAREILKNLLAADSRVLPEPEPQIVLGALADSSVNVFVRPWVNTENYWPFLFDYTEAVKVAFDEAGIVIPFPQRDLHIYQHAAESSLT